MKKRFEVSLSNGLDSFLRVTMTLRRRNVNLKYVGMTEENINADMVLVIDELETPSDVVLNYMQKMHDVKEVKIFS